MLSSTAAMSTSLTNEMQHAFAPSSPAGVCPCSCATRPLSHLVRPSCRLAVRSRESEPT